MPKFALIKIDQVKGKINFYKLEIDGTCEFESSNILEDAKKMIK